MNNSKWTDDELAYLMDHGIAGYMERYPGYRSYDAVRVKHGVLRKGMGAASAAPIARTESGTPPPYARSLGYTEPDDTTRSITPPTVTSITGVQAGERPDVDEIRRRAEEQFARITKSQERKQHQHVYFDHGPVALFFVGDQHLVSPGVDVARVFREQEMILNTPGAHVVLMGDVVDNMIVQKLMSENLNHRTTNDEDWLLAKHYIDLWGDKVIAYVGGNHTGGWTMRMMGLDLDRQIAPDHAIYDLDDVTFTAHIGPHEVKIRARHKWQGSSIYSDSHALERAARFDSSDPDVFVGAHIHRGSSYREFNLNGKRKAALLSSAYKIHDGYARSSGFPRNDASTAVGLVINNDGSWWGTANIGAIMQYQKAVYRGAA